MNYGDHDHSCAFDHSNAYDHSMLCMNCDDCAQVRAEEWSYVVFVEWDGATLRPQWGKVQSEELYPHDKVCGICKAPRLPAA